MWLLKNAIIDPLKNAIKSVQKGVNYIIMMLNINGFNYKCLILCYLDVYHITHNIVIHSPPDMSELCLCITYTCMYSKYIHVYYLHTVTIYNPYKLPTPGFATGDAQWWSITAEVPFFTIVLNIAIISFVQFKELCVPSEDAFISQISKKIVLIMSLQP